MTEFLATLVVLLALAALSLRVIKPFNADERPLLWLSFVVHQIAGAANIVVAEYYYGYGDMLTYRDHGFIIADRLREDFWGMAPGLVQLILHHPTPLPIPLELQVSSSGSMQGVSAFAMYFLFDSLYATCALIAGLAFFSKIALYVLVREELPHLSERALLWTCTLVPSVVFWTSAMLKEPIAMIGVYFGLHALHRLLNGSKRVRSLLVLVLCAVIILMFKGYILPVLGASVGTWYFARRLRERGPDIVLSAGRVVVAAAVAMVAITVTGMLLPAFAFDALRDQLAGNQVAGASIEGGSNYTLGSGSGNAAAQLTLAPLALFTALFRPLLFEAKSSLVVVNALETTVFLVAAVWVPFRRGILESVRELLRRPYLAFCFVFVVTFGTFTGLGSTNLGTLSRYRAPAVPFFATLLLALLAAPRARVVPSIGISRRPTLDGLEKLPS